MSTCDFLHTLYAIKSVYIKFFGASQKPCTIRPQTERVLGLEKTCSVQKPFNFLFNTQFKKFVQLRGFLPLLCSKKHSVQNFLDPIEIRSVRGSINKIHA